jgi:hypothetical protein
MRRFSWVFLIAFLAVAGRAEAVTVKDIIDLSRAGLGEVVLLALIEVDGGVFTIDTDTLTRLKAAGVTDKVIEAMVRSGRSRPEPPPAAAPEQQPQPQVIVIEHEPAPPVVQQVVVPVPVYVPVVTRTRTRGHVVRQVVEPPRGFGASVPGFTPITSQPVVAPKAPEPVYWGWGGKLRPDAWKPAPRKD